jgi:hypothetical protein
MFGQLLAHLFRPSIKRPAEDESDPAQSNPLIQYFYNNPGRAIDKWCHYFEIYHRHFARFRGKSPVVVEIGVWKGGSLQMWQSYFGPGCQVTGIDIDPETLNLQGDGTSILIGDQSDRNFLASVRERLPRIDILIDDGGHKMTQQIATFEELYLHIQPNGVYLCEDMHTSLWPEFGGGSGRSDTFLEYGKALVDRLSAWYSCEPEKLVVDAFTRSTHSMHFYDSVLVIEKRRMEPPKRYVSERSP